MNEDVKAMLYALPRDMRASFERIVSLMEEHGLERVREPYVKHLEGPLWEMRLKGKSGIATAVCVTAVGMRVVVVPSLRKRRRRRRGMKSVSR